MKNSVTWENIALVNRLLQMAIKVALSHGELVDLRILKLHGHDLQSTS
jgi:hypothetical protein